MSDPCKYEYHLMYWGQVQNDKWVERDLGITGNDFWFSTNKEREDFKARLESVASSHGVIIAFSEHDGTDVRKRTVARMTFVLPDGRSLPFEYDFGYGYGVESAEYMFTEGNYACDCNISGFLADRYPGIEKMECGDIIRLDSIAVTKE